MAWWDRGVPELRRLCNVLSITASERWVDAREAGARVGIMRVITC
jgi:hypothetical protein